MRSAAVVVIGGGYAGLIAALRAARRRPEGGVTMIAAEDALVERIRLHEALVHGREVRRSLRDLLEGSGVELVVDRARRIDAQARRVELASGEAIEFEQAIVAVGTHIALDRIPGAREHARTLDPGAIERERATLEALAERRGRVVIVGGGLTGVETAAELAESFPSLDVTLVTRGALCERSSKRTDEYVRHTLARLGVALHEGTSVQAVEPGRVCTDRGELPFDLCLWTAGFEAPSLARDSGLAVDSSGRMKVDAHLRSIGAPRIFGAGDCATSSATLGSPLPMGCKTAMPMGTHAAEAACAAIGGRDHPAFDWRDLALCVSLGRRAGYVQWMNADGTPSSHVVTGRAGAWLKEAVCRFVVLALEGERRGIGYGWAKVGRAALAAAPSSAV